jgi:2-iminobutanoate/2-iminopropanoate deaminase
MIKTGPFYQMAGMIALDDEGQLRREGPKEETRQILANLQKALPDFGLTLENLVHATVFTTDFAKFPEINEAWEEVFVEGVTPPSRSAIGVAALPLDATVEIEFRLYRG